MIVSNKIFNFTLAAATSAGVVGVQSVGVADSAHGAAMWLLGAGLSTLVAANVGAFLGMLIAEPVKPPSKMWAMFVAVSLLAATCVAVGPFVPGFGWLAKAPPQALGLIFAFLGRWGVPAIVKHLPVKIAALLGSKEKGAGE